MAAFIRVTDMKVAFVQNLPVMLDSYLALSSCLKKAGHKTEVFVDSYEDDIVRSILSSKPNLVGFNCLTGSYKYTLDVASRIKQKRNIPVIVGGVHPTFFPETLDYNLIDYVCRGEGEEALVELCNAISNNQDVTNIRNIWAKTNGGVIETPMRSLIRDLDTIPYNDWRLYDKYRGFLNSHVISYRASRGCPYSCSFCFNSSLHKLYKGQRVYREFSINYVMEELKEIKNRYKNLRIVFLSDESFGVNKKWSEELLKRYKEEVGLPYVITGRADFIDDGFARLLKDTGCHYINLSVETGNEKLRKTVLNKNLTNEAALSASLLLKKYGIKVRVTCIFCLPDESIDNAFEDIYLLKKMKVDHPVGFLLQPFPKTPIYDYAVEKGYIQHNLQFEELDPLVFFETPMNLPNKKQMIVIQRLFFYAVRIPLFSTLLKLLIYIPDNPIFHLFHKISICIIHKGFYQLSIPGLIKYLIACRKLKK